MRRQILLARLRRRGTEFFAGKAFVEIEPRFVSLTWPDAEPAPLRVVYDGFGSAAYLAPSPATQLMTALIRGGVRQVFCVSRCFTSSYIDEVEGTESLILSAQQLDTTVREISELAQEAVRTILGDVSTLPAEFAFLQEEWREVIRTWPPVDPIAESGRPEVHLFEKWLTDEPLPTLRAVQLFRIHWPALDRGAASIVVADGATQLLGDVRHGALTLHLDRMIRTLEDEDVRRLGHLGFGHGKSDHRSA